MAVAPIEKTQWHRLLGAELEMLLTPVGIEVLTEIQIGSNPPKADILLIRRNHERWTREQLQFLPDGIRQSHAQHILLEFKYSETFDENVVQQALGYDYFYWQGQNLTRAEIETFVISARTPRVSTLNGLGYESTATPGVYRSSHRVLQRAPLVVLNELSSEPHNWFVQCFASKRRVRVTAFGSLNQGKYWQLLNETMQTYLSGLRNLMVTQGEDMGKTKEVVAVTVEMLVESGRKLRKEIVATLTPQERLNGVDPQQLLAGLAPEQRLAGLAPEQRLAGLAPEQRLAGLTSDEMVELMEQIEAHLRAQKQEKPVNQTKRHRSSKKA